MIQPLRRRFYRTRNGRKIYEIVKQRTRKRAKKDWERVDLISLSRFFMWDINIIPIIATTGLIKKMNRQKWFYISRTTWIWIMFFCDQSSCLCYFLIMIWIWNVWTFACGQKQRQKYRWLITDKLHWVFNNKQPEMPWKGFIMQSPNIFAISLFKWTLQNLCSVPKRVWFWP